MNLIVKKFEELTLEELYDILKLRNEVFIVEQNCVYQDVDDLDLKSTHLIYKNETSIIAYTRIIPSGIIDKYIHYGRVAVKKEFRGKGLADELIIESDKIAKNLSNDTNVKISAQAYLINFYKKHSFKTFGEEYLEDGIPHIEMRKEL
ncbi:MAG: GNAT family N-acetyltransferase [Candidatus Delongbacteria bacterium]|nr:GNAT family N-acetyltransferase [Candidatus Delongbacteria bacterium]MBN2836695.1 GNAT family N-acetyltransferase [Candidatus Delongbacteria bacterium]